MKIANPNPQASPDPLSAFLDPKNYGEGMLSWGARAGLVGGAVGLGSRLFNDSNQRPQPGHYDPSKVLGRLGNITNIGLNHSRVDLPYPVFKPKTEQQQYEEELEKEKAEKTSEEVDLNPVPKPLRDDSVGSALAIPAMAAGGGLLGIGVGNYLGGLMSTASKPAQRPTTDREFLRGQLTKARDEYRKSLLEQQADRLMPGLPPQQPKLAHALDRLYKAYEKKGVLEFDKMVRGISEAPRKAIGNLMGTPMAWGLGIGAAGAGVAGLSSYLNRKSQLNKDDPIPAYVDPNEEVVKAVKLRARALAAGRGLPPVNINPIGIGVNDEKDPRQLKTASWEELATDFINKVF